MRDLVSTAPTMQLVGVALFHTAGEAAWLMAASGSISDGLLDGIESEFGVLDR